MVYLAALAAAAVSFVIGSIWYGPLFGNLWVKEKFGPAGMQKPSRNKIIALMASTFLLSFIIALGFAAIPQMGTIFGSAILGGLLWLFFVMPVLITQAMYGGATLKLVLIDLAYWLIVFKISAMVVAWVLA
ncbi:MAG: DUF1761 domain-containing protein [Patescibacteria group bacterium]